MKLSLEKLAPYLPYGLRGVCTEEFTGIETVYGMNYYKESQDVYLITSFDDLDIEYFKPILRPLSDLTKEIEYNGEKFIPLIKLFMLARGSYDINIKHYSIMSPQWIKIEMLGYKDYHLRLISIEGDVRLDKGYSFEMFSTDLRCDDKKTELVQNHNLLFQKLYEWHFDIYELINHNLAIDINTLNQDL